MAARPTPHSIALGTLIALDSDPSFDLYDESNEEEKEGNERLWDSVQSLVLGEHDVSSGKCQGLVDLLRQVQSCVGQRTRDLLLEYVSMSASSIDALVDLMESLRASVKEGIVDGQSSYGIYLRKICLGFDGLSFEAVTRLWEALRESVNSAKVEFGIETTEPLDSGETSKELNAEESKSSENSMEWLWPQSSQSIEKSLRNLCISMEKGGEESYEETEVKIRSILERDPELPAAHFVRFLNCLKHRERAGAIDALHQYFDYAMIKDRKDSKGKPKQDVLQYAAVLLAALHSSFGDADLSQSAAEEAVRVAQASGDKACVAYALGWLHHNAKAQFGHDELLQRCSSRAVDSKLRTLSGGANLELARHCLTAPAHRGLRTTSHLSPSQAWERVMESTADRNASSSGFMMDNPTHTADFSSSTDALALLARQGLVGSGVWDSFGFGPLSGLSSFVSLHCLNDHMSSHDIAVAVQDIARVALHGFGQKTIPLSSSPGELGIQSHKPRYLDNSCVYSVSLMKLVELKRQYPKAASTSWKISVLFVLHEWAVRRGELGHAGSLGHTLHGCLHPRIPNYREVLAEAYAQHALLLSREGSWDRAKHLTKRVCSMCKDWGLRKQHAAFLIQLAVVKFEASPHNHISALTPLLDCLSMCEEFAMDSLHATALSLLAKVQLQLQNVNRAVSLLKASLSTLLRGGHVWFQGEAFLTLAKCELYKAKQFQKENQKRKLSSFVRSASKYLERSRGYFERCQDAFRLREIFYLQARIYNEVPGHQEKRDEASGRFKRVCTHLVRADSPLWPDALDSVSVSGLERLASRQLPTS